MEMILSCLLWAWVLGGVAAIAGAVWFLLGGIAEGMDWKWYVRHKKLSLAICFLLVCAALGWINRHPVVSCIPECEAQCTPQIYQSAADFARGEWPLDGPMAACSVRITSIEEEYVTFEVRYFLLGTEVAQVGPDGYAVVKGLGKQ